jgi:phosphoribosylanthranilate isomerase
MMLFLGCRLTQADMSWASRRDIVLLSSSTLGGKRLEKKRKMRDKEKRENGAASDHTLRNDHAGCAVLSTKGTGSVRIKICGVTNVEDARQAALLGADAVGLNFFPGSNRYITPDIAKEIIRALPSFVEAVGVFVNSAALDELIPWTANGLTCFQLHGDVPALLPDLRCRWITAFPVRNRESLNNIDQYLDLCRQHGRMPDAILTDAHVPGEFGGTGRLAPWELLADYRPPVPLILAGGLTPDNVAEAVRMVRPYAVDVASGVESSPGRKDAHKMRCFIERARTALS